MELPEDVLGLVRAFSKPRFKHFRVYNQALKVFGKEKWPALQKKLESSPEEILPTFLSYQEVYLNRKETMNQIYMHREIIPKGILHRSRLYDESVRLSDLVWQYRRLEDQYYRKLFQQLYGHKLAPDHLYLDYHVYHR